MKKYFKIILSVFLAASVMSCVSDDDAMVDLSSLEAPSNLGANFQITQDNTGLVTVTPTGDGAVLYDVDFGDGSSPAEDLETGESVEHIYDEGEYEVVVTGKNLNGEMRQGSQPLTVSFRAPENLETEIVKDAENNYKITVTANAQYAAMFEVYFGEATGDESSDEDEEPVLLMPGESVTYTYENVGDYNVRVVALSGGAATTEVTKEVSITDPLFLPIDFESETLNYTFYNFGGGEGAGAPVIDNPDPSGINTSSKVASYTKPSGSEVWAGTTIALDEPIDFSSKRYVSVDVWSPTAGTPVLFKIENLDDSGIFVESTATTTVSNAWETLVFDLTAIDPAVEYGRIALFFNFGTPGTGETYYFDNIQTTRLEKVDLPLNFENENLSYTWNGFGGASGSVIDNPDVTGANSSAKVSQLTKGDGAETWAGISMNLDGAVDFTNGTTVKMKVWSPKAGTPILFKMEDSQSAPDNNGNPSVVVEVVENTTTSNQWEEMTFDLTDFDAFDPNNSYDRVIVFYDFGNTGDGSTFYFDDIRLTSEAQATSVALPLYFEAEALTYTWNGFGGASGSVIANPDPSGINSSSRVSELTKGDGAETWAGISLNLEEAVNFSNGTTIKMKAWSPKEGVPVLFKFEDSQSAPDNNGNPSVVVEVIENTATSNEWEEMTFDLTSFDAFDPNANYDRVVIFYDFGTNGDGSTFYFDDIQLTN
ncbi:hypothetical protein [Salegentibacter chungangensis]|uniref:PKD/Chitinase domain-containing protein n=1 Tax=Salegentibacter chungangensis TaxID=1335724 RepID=A0ABW3NQF9_9FLAO